MTREEFDQRIAELTDGTGTMSNGWPKEEVVWRFGALSVLALSLSGSCVLLAWAYKLVLSVS